MNRIASRFKETFNREVLQEFRWVFAYILRYKKAVIFYILIGVAGTVMGLAGSLASKYVIDAVTQFNFSLLLTMAVVFTASGLLSIGLNAWTSRMLAKISLKVQQEILEDVYCRIMDQRLSGQFVLHRIQKIKKDSFYAVGDAQNEIEGPILFTRIRGVVQAVYRKGRWHSCHSIGDWLFQSAWRKLLPIRNRIFRLFRIYWRWKVKK